MVRSKEELYLAAAIGAGEPDEIAERITELIDARLGLKAPTKKDVANRAF